jgi:hypothetical protein
MLNQDKAIFLSLLDKFLLIFHPKLAMQLAGGDALVE